MKWLLRILKKVIKNEIDLEIDKDGDNLEIIVTLLGVPIITHRIKL